MRVLRGGRGLFGQQRVRLVLSEVRFLEIHHGQGFFNEIYEFLRSQNSVIGLYRCEYAKGYSLSWGDALFINPQWHAT